MTKNMFLNELRRRLVGLPQDDLDNRISFYEEMIDDRISEGKSEEEAVADIGSVDDIVKQIANETPLFKLVKERTKPKRSLKAWEIVLIVVGFPLWFPLLITAFVLTLVAYILIWVLVIVSYSIELALAASSIAGFIAFFAYMINGTMNYQALGAAIMCLGAAILFYFACIGATKITIKLSKNIILAIKSAFIRKGKNK